MTSLWQKLRKRLGGVALLGAGLLVVGLLFFVGAVRPLEDKLARLDARLAKDARSTSGKAFDRASPSAKLAAFYGYFDRQEDQVEWLAKLYGTAQATGLELRSASYRLVEADDRITRHEVALPLSGTYTQLRTFLSAALDENPVLSLDQINLRRKRVNDTLLEAEAVMSIHLPRR